MHFIRRLVNLCSEATLKAGADWHAVWVSQELLHATMDLFRELLARGKEARARGLDADQAKAEILPGLRPLMLRMTHDDPKLKAPFEVYLVDWYLHRVYDEQGGPLSDDIGPIPAR